MTRFMISLRQGVELVWHAFDDLKGGEIYVKKIPSIKITDIAKAIVPEAKYEIIGIRPGEKLHEQMISTEDSFEALTKTLPEGKVTVPLITGDIQKDHLTDHGVYIITITLQCQ